MFHHPGIDPFPVMIPTEWDEDGQPTAYDQRPHYNVSAEFFGENEEALAPYRVAPNPLAQVFMGDPAGAPTWTVALRFPDEETFQGVMGAWLVEPEADL